MAGAQPRTILVLYGSETGNAQDMAEELGRICQRLHFKGVVEEMDGVSLGSLLEHQLVIFVLSTTGQGDMPHNSMLFWKRLLQKKLSPGCLAQLQYTCFGLGDSTYLKFNWAARKLVRRLDQLGAATFFDTFEADEQFPDGTEGSFARWSTDLSQHLLDKYPHPSGLEPIPNDVILPPRWSLEPALRDIEPNPIVSKEHGDAVSSPSFDNTPTIDLLPVPDGWVSTLSSNKRTTPDSHWQDVRLLSFDIPPRPIGAASSEMTAAVAKESLRCQPGDCLTIYPKNFREDVQRLITIMGWDTIADSPLDLSKCESLPRNLYTPLQTTLRSLLLNNIDITAIPRRSFLRSMSFFSTDDDHKERLLEFNMAEYIDEYFDYATRSRRTIIEVLEEFTSVRLPAERLFDIFPIIRGRDFSIANGGAQLYPEELQSNSAPTTGATHQTATRVDLLVALVRYKTILRKPRQGLCSRYLADMPVGMQLTVTRKKVISSIHGTDNGARPLIAMATGTGIAPVRSLIHERLTHPSVGLSMLFFGNRNRAADYFFQDEWMTLGTDGATTKTTTTTTATDARTGQTQDARGDEGKDGSSQLTIFAAFSRDQREKIYVQDLIRQQAPALAELMHHRPIFVVCGGSSKMADACKSAVFDPFIAAAGDNESEKEERKKILDGVTWWQEIW